MKKSFELDKAYDPKKYQADIYKQWEESGAFTPDGNEHLRKDDPGKQPFTIVMPPPNANGDLHIGHALTTTLEDIMTRYHRMQGAPSLFLPGADHAGFETQVVYERKLALDGKSRFDFSRKELYQQIWDFVHANKGNMERQQRQLGASADWSRNTFTLDEHIVKRTRNTFKQLHDDGLLYRGKYIVNFCTFHGTSFSELEVEYKDVEGHLWHIDYPVVDSDVKITVATTRPETMLGDTAVAVHPEDDRYRHLVGQMVRLPLTDRLIPIVADTAVEREFGTGAVKVTPAHDPNDFQMAERHNLPLIQVIGTDGKITDEAPAKFRGMTVNEARKAVASELEFEGAMTKTEDYAHSVGHCYKCGTVIEPLVIDQWLLRMKPLAARAMQALENGAVKIVPEQKTRALFQWLENIKDWNICRQIVWGIPIPAFFSEDGDVIIDLDEQGETITRDGKTYHHDTDTFDTWFSSSQWPFATLKYPDHEDFKRFYPTSVMETAGEILFFWVARMIMLGLYVTGEVPFRTVYLHGLVLDAHGKKMSKSKGNVISPIGLLETYGADALRLGIIANRSAGLSQGFDEKRVEGYRNFANKLWNVARFILGTLPEDYKPAPPKLDSPADQWIQAKLDAAVVSVTKALDEYRFSDAGALVYSLLWDDFADWYVEASKVSPNPDLLVHSLETILKLVHPMAPFISEAIWRHLPWQTTRLIVTAWPKPSDAQANGAAFETVRALVAASRAIAAEEHLSKPVIMTTDEALLAHADLIKHLARASRLKHVDAGSGLYLGLHTPAWLEATNEQVAARQHRLQAQRADKQKYLSSLEAKLANQGYVKSAPPQVVADTRARQAETQALLAKLDEQLSTLQA